MKPAQIHLLILLSVLCFSTVSFAQPGEQKLHIAMVLWRGETKAERGFMDGMEDLGYSPSYSLFDAQQDLKRLGLLLHQISENIGDYDYIYTFGTTVSRRAKVVINNRVPQLFNAVTDPLGAGIIEPSNMASHLIGGASDSIPSSLQIEAIMQVMKLNKLGLFFNPREKNSMIIRNEFYKHASEKHFEIVDFRSPPVGEVLEKNLQAIVNNPEMVDAVYFPSDSYLASKAQIIGAQLQKSKIASFGSLKEYIEAGILMGFVVDYQALGKSVATIVDQHQRGKNLGDIPLITPNNFPLYINKATLELVEVQLPENMVKKGIFYHSSNSNR